MSESKVRSIVKSISWRIVATLTTITLVFIFTGKIVLALSVGVIEVILKMSFYYFHERVWNKVKWGEECKDG
jgi:uncharacterized membrane protein